MSDFNLNIKCKFEVNNFYKPHFNVLMKVEKGDNNMNVNEFINKAKEIERMKTKYKLGTFMNKQEGDTYLCDCSGIIKAIFWGYPGGKYQVNGLPDINADRMISQCDPVTTDFTEIQPGWLVWMKGHIGIYIGDGVVIESTAAWEKKVLRSYCRGCGIPNKYNLHDRQWTKCGAFSYIQY